MDRVPDTTEQNTVIRAPYSFLIEGREKGVGRGVGRGWHNETAGGLGYEAIREIILPHSPRMRRFGSFAPGWSLDTFLRGSFLSDYYYMFGYQSFTVGSFVWG